LSQIKVYFSDSLKKEIAVVVMANCFSMSTTNVIPKEGIFSLLQGHAIKF
jgi:hypothetical protein